MLSVPTASRSRSTPRRGSTSPSPRRPRSASTTTTVATSTVSPSRPGSTSGRSGMHPSSVMTTSRRSPTTARMPVRRPRPTRHPATSRAVRPRTTRPPAVATAVRRTTRDPRAPTPAAAAVPTVAVAAEAATSPSLAGHVDRKTYVPCAHNNRLVVIFLPPRSVIITQDGALAEQLRSGLQNRVDGCDSRTCLHLYTSIRLRG